MMVLICLPIADLHNFNGTLGNRRRFDQIVRADAAPEAATRACDVQFDFIRRYSEDKRALVPDPDAIMHAATIKRGEPALLDVVSQPR